MMKKTSLKITCAAVAVAMAAVSVTALGGCSGDNTNGKSENTAAFDYAKARVGALSSERQRVAAIFTDECFSKAALASMLYKADMSDEDLEQICRYLYLDSITVTDETGVITACIPADDMGKKIKETSDKSKFNKIVKGMSVKLMNDPVPVEGSEDYTILAGVARTDAGGAVVVGFTTDEYASTTGEQWAQQCGANVLILENGAVLSSTLEGVDKGTAAADLGITDESLAAKVGDKEYTFQSADIDTYTLLVAE